MSINCSPTLWQSSLAEKAILQTGFAFETINFHLCTSEQEIIDIIIKHVSQLIGKAIGKIDQIILSLKKYLTHLQPKISFGGKEAKLELIANINENPAEIIFETLMLLEKLLRDKKKKAILFS